MPEYYRSPFFKTFNAEKPRRSPGQPPRREPFGGTGIVPMASRGAAPQGRYPRPVAPSPLHRNPHAEAAQPDNLQHYALLRGVLARGEAPMPMSASPMPKQPDAYRIPPPVMPAPKTPSAMPAMPIAPPAKAAESSPADAAAHFRNINKGLPDGVQFEPLDPETKALLESLGKLPPEPQKPTASPPVAPVAPAAPVAPVAPATPTESAESAAPVAPVESAALLERLIQDERNAALYYQYLSGIATSPEHQSTLREMADECEARRSRYHGLMESLHGRAYEPKNTPVNTGIGFNKGMEMAVEEENKMLGVMAQLLDSLAADPAAFALQNLIAKRLIRLNWLLCASLKTFA